MLSYLSRAFHDPALCLPFSQHNLDKTTDDTLCSFGDLFCPKSISSRTDFYEDYSTPEFDLTGFFEECLDAISLDSPGQADAKLSNELASTQANENSVTDLEVLKSPDYDKGKEDFELELDMLSTISIASLLKKRAPSSKDDSSPLTNSKPADLFLTEFDHETSMRSQVVDLVVRLIDREPLSKSDISILDQESIQLISNFSFMIYSLKITFENLEEDLDFLKAKISSTTEKKKRNEERIKYIFKRVNKIMLRKYMDQFDIDRPNEGCAMRQILLKYFGSVIRNATDSTSLKEKCSFDRYLRLLYKPSNMYRDDLRDVFRFPSYLQAFREILENDFVGEFKKKRHFKIESCLRDIKTEIFFCSDKTDPTLLKRKVSRLPWSLSEVKKGLSIFMDYFRMN